jgi:predicted ATPase with chaperone activity
LVQRVNRLAVDAKQPGLAETSGYIPIAEAPPTYGDFVPQEPVTLEETGLSSSDIESLILKLMLARGNLTGREVTEHIKLPFTMVDRLLREMKHDQLIVYRNAAPMNDYVHQLTELGRERAKRLVDQCSYFGSAPVSLPDYVASVRAQSLTRQHPTCEDLQRALQDLLIAPKMLARLGPAINSGRGLFLYGAPGNGKTSIAERLTGCFGPTIWIPRALGVDGEIIRFFDPMSHEEATLERPAALYDHAKIDKRWVRIRRPSIIAGGELTMDSLEVSLNTSTGISEAPVQLKSNCGTLVIDDFGHQRMSTRELLSRWIVPLEKRYDFLNLANGKKIQVPFDQLIVFSTNLEPRDLADEAFLRRIPYKIEVGDPSETEFRQLLAMMCKTLNIPYRQEPIDYLIEKHYRAAGRPFRRCQPRDLLMQIRNHCFYQGIPAELTNEYFDFSVETYFAVL